MIYLKFLLILITILVLTFAELHVISVFDHKFRYNKNCKNKNYEKI